MKAPLIVGTLTALLATSLPAQDNPKSGPAVDVTKARPAGMALEWTHFIGGSRLDQASSLALDREGMLYVAGITSSSDFPTTSDALLATQKGGYDMFLLRFNTRRQEIVYSTLLGGAGWDKPSSLGVDPTRNQITLAGYTNSSDYPTTADAITSQFVGPGDSRNADGFLTILADEGRTLEYSTFIGGQRKDEVQTAFVGPAGEMTLFGITESPGFPATDAIRSAELDDGPTLFAMRLDATRQRVLSSRFLANSGPWEPDIQRLDSGDFLIAGNTSNPSFHATSGAYSRTYRGGRPETRPGGRPGAGDLFVMRLAADLDTISFATLFGGTGDESNPRIAAISDGDIFIVGRTTSKDLPVTADAIERTLEGQAALFVARFSGDGRRLKFCTYLGGQGGDASTLATSLLYDGRSTLYLAGRTSSPRFPVTPDAMQPNRRGREDVFLLAFNATDNSLAYASYLGGSGSQGDPFLALEPNGSLYVVGLTDSADFPTREPNPEPRKSEDIFISKFSVRDCPAATLAATSSALRP